jgi:hypothetical protein
VSASPEPHSRRMSVLLRKPPDDSGFRRDIEIQTGIRTTRNVADFPRSLSPTQAANGRTLTSAPPFKSVSAIEKTCSVVVESVYACPQLAHTSAGTARITTIRPWRSRVTVVDPGDVWPSRQTEHFIFFSPEIRASIARDLVRIR